MNDKMQKTMTWLAETCDAALLEAQNGDTSLLNRLGKNGSFAYYLNNVHTRKVMSPEQFVSQFPHLVKELNETREQYELVTSQPERDARLQVVEEGLTKLTSMVQQLLEAQKPAEIVTEAAKPAKKGKKAEETEPVTEDETSEEE